MEYLGLLTDDEDMLELVDIIEPRRAEKIYRNRENQFEKWNNTDFIKRFRLSKDAVHFLLDNITHIIASPTERNHAVSPEDMVLVTLRFYATGSFLQVVADFIGIDKSTASRIIHKVSRAIASLHGQFVKMPTCDEELARNSQQFYRIARFPRCFGAVDCTHIKIAHPGGIEPEIYRNRKGFFSINVQVVCDAELKIENIVCRWPGSSHDSTIFNNSVLRQQCENGNFGNYVLVGDSGYGIRPFLITPLTNPRTAAEHLFNESQIRTRNPIERCFGIGKRRFPVLVFGIRLQLHKVEAVVVATAVLHNVASIFKDPLPPINEEEEGAFQLVNNVNIEALNNANNFNINNMTRFQLITEYFNRLL